MLVGARARALYDEQAKARQQEAGKRYGRGKEKVVEDLPQAIEGKARDHVGKAVGVSGRSIDYATKVLKELHDQTDL